MTTVRTITSTQQTLIRDLKDLDPKVRNQIPVVAIAVIAGLAGWLTGHLTLIEAGAIVGPPILALAIAYITTSTHKDLIVEGIKTGADLLHSEAPVIEAAIPQSTPIIEDVESLAAAVQQGVIDSTSTIPTQPGLPTPTAAQ